LCEIKSKGAEKAGRDKKKTSHEKKKSGKKVTRKSPCSKENFLGSLIQGGGTGVHETTKDPGEKSSRCEKASYVQENGKATIKKPPKKNHTLGRGAWRGNRRRGATTIMRNRPKKLQRKSSRDETKGLEGIHSMEGLYILSMGGQSRGKVC